MHHTDAKKKSDATSYLKNTSKNTEDWIRRGTGIQG